MQQLIICYIGGGSAEWAVKLMRDLALEEELRGELRLYDVDRPAAQTNLELGEALFGRPEAGGRFLVTLASSLASALEGSDIVVLSIEPGPTELRYADLEIPESYGILQTVGDTVGPGGALRAWRAIPTFVEFGRQIARRAPDAWIINYTNPMTLCTAAIHRGFPEAKCVGCCHEVPHMQEHLSRFLGSRNGGSPPSLAEIETDVVGINHFTFASRITWKGTDVLEELRHYAKETESKSDLSENAQRRIDERSWFESDHRIALEFLRRFGAYGFAGDRHLAEFVPWFLTSEVELHRYGVIRTPFWWRKEKNENRRKRDPRKEADQALTPSGEEGIAIIRALAGGKRTKSNANVLNRGQIPWLPEGHPVETYASFGQDSITPEMPAPPPVAVQELTRRAVAVQALTMEAALERNRSKLLEAIMLDPLSCLPVSRVASMVGEMLTYIEEHQ